MLAEMTPQEFMEWQALVRLEERERNGPKPAPEQPTIKKVDSKAMAKKLNSFMDRYSQAAANHK